MEKMRNFYDNLAKNTALYGEVQKCHINWRHCINCSVKKNWYSILQDEIIVAQHESIALMNKINHEEEYLKEAKEIALRLNTSPD